MCLCFLHSFLPTASTDIGRSQMGEKKSLEVLKSLAFTNMGRKKELGPKFIKWHQPFPRVSEPLLAEQCSSAARPAAARAQ